MKPRRKMWAVETLDARGEGIDIVLARTKEEAVAWAKSRNAAHVEITSAEPILGIQLALVSGERGESYYYKICVEKDSDAAPLHKSDH